jgi:hypothetical protein
MPATGPVRKRPFSNSSGLFETIRINIEVKGVEKPCWKLVVDALDYRQVLI